MPDRVDELKREFSSQLALVTDRTTLENLRTRFLGRKGLLNQLMSELPSLPPTDRPSFGQRANVLKEYCRQQIDSRLESLGKPLPTTTSVFDVTLPGKPLNLGHQHLISQTLRQMCDIFGRIGFSTAYGPEVETPYYNFQALNTPPGHPSTEPSDTFYLESGMLLRTHTSPVQVRIMENRKPPIRIVVPGRVYRPDTPDASHSFMFHQLEGLMVDSDVTFSDLKTVLGNFCREFYGPDVRIRLRPHFFPFTEPSAELDISCILCAGKGCQACSRKGWLEVAGCGMVDPNVFEAVGIDTEEFTGFAFGFGVERATMLKYRINDIRLFYENDVRFLNQF